MTSHEEAMEKGTRNEGHGNGVWAQTDCARTTMASVARDEMITEVGTFTTPLMRIIKLGSTCNHEQIDTSNHIRFLTCELWTGGNPFVT
jgi:hypothetical protein